MSLLNIPGFHMEACCLCGAQSSPPEHMSSAMCQSVHTLPLTTRGSHSLRHVTSLIPEYDMNIFYFSLSSVGPCVSRYHFQIISGKCEHSICNCACGSQALYRGRFRPVSVRYYTHTVSNAFRANT